MTQEAQNQEQEADRTIASENQEGTQQGTNNDGAGGENGSGSETVLGNPGGDLPQAAPADWPEDWPEKMAASIVGSEEGDEYEKELKELKRSKSPVDIAKRLQEARKKISSGQIKEDNPFPVDGTDEEKADWRKDNGLPEEAKGYLDGLPDGLAIGEADEPLVMHFLDAVHAAGGDQGEVNRALSAYYQVQEDMAAQRAEQDKQIRIDTEEALRAELGSEYRGEMQGIMGFLDSAPEGVKETILNSRGPDGTPLASDIQVLQWLRYINNEINPAGTVVKAGSGNAIQSIETEIGEIETLMRDTTSDYWVGPKSTQYKSRYKELLEARDKLKKRDAA